MASMEKRTDSKGRTRYRVRWRNGGTRTGAWESATFDRQQQARDFKVRVESAGHHWPDEVIGASTAPGTLTVDQLAQDYLADRAKRVRSDRTPADYRRDYTNWVAPTFGARMADEITADDVQAWVDGMIEGTVEPGRPSRKRSTNALAPKSVADRHAILSGIYARAIVRRAIEVNPCAETVLPKRQKGAPKGLRPMEWDALHAALQQVDPHAADLALFLLATGWRWSEATALSVFDVEDYGAEELHVTMGRVFRRNAAGQHVLVDEGKGQSSVRRISPDADAAAMIRARMTGKAGDALVFTTKTGAQWHYSNFRDRAWTPAVDLANLSRRPTPHWLRHTHVVWMDHAGASMPELQSRIGHASITTTIGVYGRMLTDVSPDALTKFAAMRGARTALPSHDRAAIGS